MIASVLAPQAWCWFTRATGIVAWIVITLAMVWGLVFSMKSVRRRGVPAWIADLHRHLGGLALVFTALHLASLVADNFVHFGARELLVPMASPWKPGPVAWGIVAFYVLCIVQITSWCMRFLPRRIWHRLHLMSFVLYVTVTVHGITAGTDRVNRLVQAAGLIGLTWVVSMASLRVLARDPNRAAPASGGDDKAARLAALADRGRSRASTSAVSSN
jgi:DMSO/TMAO reductase YedYZ heme-binding membrane subunit